MSGDPLGSLLRWGIQNSDPKKLEEMNLNLEESRKKMQNCDPEMMDHILGYNKNNSKFRELVSCVVNLENLLAIRTEKFNELLDLSDSEPNICFDIERFTLWPSIISYVQSKPDTNEERILLSKFLGLFLKSILSNNLPLQQQFIKINGIECLLDEIRSGTDLGLKCSFLSLLGAVICGGFEFAKEASDLGLKEIVFEETLHERFVSTSLRIVKFCQEEYKIFEWTDYEKFHKFIESSSLGEELKSFSHIVAKSFGSL